MPQKEKCPFKWRLVNYAMFGSDNSSKKRDSIKWPLRTISMINPKPSFSNMVKGEGLKGLTGIPLNKRNVIRPLMFATREDLEHYARNHHIKWREDSTNKEDNYHRNFIRHQIFPRLHKINPGLK